MLLLGLTKTTLLDYPGHVASTIFTGGCNFRCPFCHNGQLVLNPAGEESISEEEVFDHLRKRKNVLDGVCITGGEPTIQADLYIFIQKIKDMGYSIKLDTNGTNPQLLEKLVEDKLIDYVAMDVKNTSLKYPETAFCTENALKRVKESVDYLLKGMIPYEFRTTVVRELHDAGDLKEIASWIAGADCWYIQSYKDSDNVIDHRFHAYSKEELEEMILGIEEVPVFLRGVE